MGCRTGCRNASESFSLAHAAKKYEDPDSLRSRGEQLHSRSTWADVTGATSTDGISRRLRKAPSGDLLGKGSDIFGAPVVSYPSFDRPHYGKMTGESAPAPDIHPHHASNQLTAPPDNLGPGLEPFVDYSVDRPFKPWVVTNRKNHPCFPEGPIQEVIPPLEADTHDATYQPPAEYKRVYGLSSSTCSLNVD
jgi:hypothetical protein